MIIDVVIPVLDEEEALPGVLHAMPNGVRRVVVADNGSRDRSAARAREAGAEVVYEPRRGYGNACLAALAHLRADPPDVVVFVDGDGSDDVRQLPRLLEPIEDGRAEFVVGSRVRGELAKGALTLPQRVGNAVACLGLRALYGARYSDLGPFRAIRWSSLERLEMVDANWGWTVEMQIKAAKKDVAHEEVAVDYGLRQGGESKVSGTVRGSVNAGVKILWLLARHGRPWR